METIGHPTWFGPLIIAVNRIHSQWYKRSQGIQQTGSAVWLPLNGTTEADRSKSTFWGAQRILWKWYVVPFGPKNTPPYVNGQGVSEFTFRLMLHRWNCHLTPHFARTFEHLAIFFAIHAGLKVHPEKCVFAMEKNEFRGHCVSAEGLSPQEEILAMLDLLSTDMSGLRSAFGLFSSFRKFVCGFSVIASPLHSLRIDTHWYIYLIKDVTQMFFQASAHTLTKHTSIR